MSTGPRRGRVPRKVTPQSLRNVALHHLQRYATTQHQLATVLTRRVRRSLRVHGGDASEAARWVREVVDRLVADGYVNDAAYSQTRAHALRGAGRSARAIAQRLRAKGVPRELAARSVSEATEEVSEEAAARIWARKRRLGPFRADAAARQARRRQDLAALVRAGFSLGVARTVVDAAPEGERP